MTTLFKKSVGDKMSPTEKMVTIGHRLKKWERDEQHF
jgi:hypothetical protein